MDNFYIFHGRFQPFHMGHIQSLKYVTDNCDGKIVIGIVNPNPQNIDPYDDVNFSNFDIRRNPLNYWQRYCCIKSSIEQFQLQDRVVGIVPMPRLSINMINSENFLPDKPRFICSYDKRLDDREKVKEAVYVTQGEKLFHIPIYTFGVMYQMISGKLLRSLIVLDHPLWKNLLPSSTIDFLEQIDLSDKIKSITSVDFAKKQLKEVIIREPKMAVKELIYDFVKVYIDDTNALRSRKSSDYRFDKQEYTRTVINMNTSYYVNQAGAVGNNASSDNNIFQSGSNTTNIYKNVDNQQFFTMLRETLSETNTDIIEAVNAMEETVGKKSFLEKYGEFMQVAAAHMTLVAPFLPQLQDLFQKALDIVH